MRLSQLTKRGAGRSLNMLIGSLLFIPSLALAAETKITASDGQAFDNFGYSVSIQGDAAVVGTPSDDNHGSAYVFGRQNGVWGEQQKLLASDAQTDDQFGYSVAIDGETVIVGANADDDNGTDAGAAYAFVLQNGVWTEQQKLIAGDGGANYATFGVSVSISGDTAIVGAQNDDDFGTQTGAAYVYIRANGVWTQQQKLLASDAESGDQFGASVFVQGDTAIVGAIKGDGNVLDTGAAYVFTRQNGVWTQQQKLIASDGQAFDTFGESVSISGDTAILGANNDGDNGSSSGSAYVFVRENGIWAEQQKLLPSDGAQHEEFGYSVSIDGDSAIIGALFDDDSGFFSGSAYVFANENGVWSEQQKLTASDAQGAEYFGISVSLDAGTVIVGAASDDDNGFASGSAYLYNLAQEVVIDIKPGSSENTINLTSDGVVPVAILSSADFDASTLDIDTLLLAVAGVRTVGKQEKPLCHLSLVNADDYYDLVCQFNTDELQLEPADTSAALEGQTLSGTAIRGEDTITIVP